MWFQMDKKVVVGIGLVVAGAAALLSLGYAVLQGPRIERLEAKLATMQACTRPEPDRPSVPVTGLDPCAWHRAVDERVEAAELRYRIGQLDVRDLADSCTRMSGLVDNSFRDFIRVHVEPAQVARAKAGFKRYKQRHGIGGGEVQ